MEHEFTRQIFRTLQNAFGERWSSIYERSPLLQYLNIKTRSASRGSKSRASFANLYAIYVLVEDYLEKGFASNRNYAAYEGARFTDLLTRQRQLPFGSKLQNHALNHRLNEEFKRFFPHVEALPVIRDVQTNRYWFNENLLELRDGAQVINLAEVILQIIDQYIQTKQNSFRMFLETCERLQEIPNADDESVFGFIQTLLAPEADARIFEIVSYAILRYYYYDQRVYFGYDPDHIQEQHLLLFKTGRTNANDGGIDFVMRPLGRFFQVTETFDFKKYFLDIEKVERYPISFVIKSSEDVSVLLSRIRERAHRQYGVHAIVEKYMGCIEEIINIPILLERFGVAVSQGHLRNILAEIVAQSKLEFDLN